MIKELEHHYQEKERSTTNRQTTVTNYRSSLFYFGNVQKSFFEPTAIRIKILQQHY